MPNKQIRTNDNFLQRDFEGTNNKRQSANNKISGNNNVVSFENNMVAGDRNSAAGKTIILGDNNLVGNPSRVAVIGRDNILTSTEGMIIGASNSLSAPLKNFYLFGVDGLTMTQSVSNVWIFGNPTLGTYSIGTQSFQNTLIAPTQSGIYANQNIFLGPSVNIFDVNGVPISGGSQNLNQVLTVGNTTGGEDIEVTSGDLILGQNQGLIDFDFTGRFVLAFDTSILSYIAIDVNNITISSDFFQVITANEEDFTFNDYAFKEINIGDWDMDTNGNVNINHGLSAIEYKTIRNIQVTIRDDNDDDYFDLSQDTGNAGIVNGGIAQWNNTTINLVRRTGGQFDGALFDATSYNRGWIRFQYKPS
jgi:hypothetical protein